MRFFASLRFAQNDNYLCIMGDGVGSGSATSNPITLQNDMTCCHSEHNEACLVARLNDTVGQGRQESLIFSRTTRFLILFFAVFLSNVCISQEVKKKTVSDSFSREEFYITKKGKLKNGSYIQIMVNTGDTLAIGQYTNDVKSGIWTYYSKGDSVYLKYNYDNSEIIFKSESITKVDTFIVFNNGSFKLSPIESPPICIAFEDKIRFYLANNLRPSIELQSQRIEGYAMASFEVTSAGEMTNIKTEKSIEAEFDKTLVKTLENFKETWKPAVYKGQQVNSKILIGVTLFNAETDGKLKINKKPYLLPIEIVYFEMVSVQRKVTFVTTESRVVNRSINPQIPVR
jgi:hypothetical protein